MCRRPSSASPLRAIRRSRPTGLAQTAASVVVTSPFNIMSLISPVIEQWHAPFRTATLAGASAMIRRR